MSNKRKYRGMTPQDDRLIEEIVKRIEDRISNNDESINRRLQQILEQTTKTNGRVSKIEQETAIGRWFERKPVRFILILIIFLMLSAEGMRSIIQSFI